LYRALVVESAHSFHSLKAILTL